MSWIKVIFINVWITLALVGFLFLLPPISGAIFGYASNLSENHNSDKRAQLEIYSDFDWASTHFNEFGALTTNYYDFITWRREDFSGKTIEVLDGNRVSFFNEKTQISKREFWFFGGSTTWGTGVNDENTYPSVFAKLAGVSVKNFGESGYVSRQSLNYFINQIVYEKAVEKSKSIHVVFYDGVNDVANLCKSTSSIKGTVRESQLRTLIASNSGVGKYDFKRTFAQLLDFALAIKNRFGVTQIKSGIFAHSCADDEHRAREVAKTLVENWIVVKTIANENKMGFSAILQPVAFLGSPVIDYLELTTAGDNDLREQYISVYPHIIAYAHEKNISVLNYTMLYDGCDDCYIDHSHVGPQAHQKLARALIKSLL